MMFAFDLISDLHAEQWPSREWSGSATSPLCIVAGGVSSNLIQTVRTLTELGKNYQAVFYIDGDNEHANRLDHLETSYSLLSQTVSNVTNLIYLQDNVIVTDGVAILGTNGWWSYNLDPTVDVEHCVDWFHQQTGIDIASAVDIGRQALSDAEYLVNSVRRLQTHKDVKKIVIVTHTCPHYALLSHDIDLNNQPQMSLMGNPHMARALEADTENKIDTWVFGHYSGSIDRTIDGIRYISHPRGAPSSKHAHHAYHARRICIDV